MSKNVLNYITLFKSVVFIFISKSFDGDISIYYEIDNV